jgi:hypothetical protein
MKSTIAKIILLIPLLLFLSEITYSQTIDETLSNLSSDAVTKYSEPAITTFSSNMNSGWFSGLPSASTLGFHAKLRFVGIGSFFGSTKNFSTNGTYRFTENQVNEILSNSQLEQQYYDDVKEAILGESWDVTIEGPTINGSRDEHVTVTFPTQVIHIDQGDFIIEEYTLELEDVKGYLNEATLLPTPALQLDLSGFAGTGISLRYFTGVDIRKLGNITFYGAGITHNINYWLSDPIPVDIGVGLYFQKFDIGSAFTNTATQFGLFASKSLGTIVTFVPYAGLTYESSHSKMNYDYVYDIVIEGVGTIQQIARIKVDYGNENSVGFIIGSTLNFPVVSVNADFKFGQTQTGSVGLGFGF